MATHSEDLASQAFRKHFAELAEAIQDPGRIALDLYANNVILRTTRDEVTLTTLTREQKNTRILAAVESQLHVNPKAFEVFLSVLKERIPLAALCRRIEETYCSREAKIVSDGYSREFSMSSSEAVSLLPESTPGSISGDDHEGLVPQGQNDTSNSFPYLDIGKLSRRDRLALQSKLLKDSDNIISEFSDLIHYTINSIVSSRISVKKLRTRLSSLGAYRPTRDPVPLLRNQLGEINRAEDVEEVFCILDDYYSFFNYGIIEKLIGWFGTPEDKERLETYTENFKRFCKRRTFECPPDIFGHTIDKGKANLVVKVEESWDPTDGCSLENVLRLCNSLVDILGVESETLYLCRIDKGCVELLFQVPSFVEEDIFPLSMEQERSLTSVGVTRLTCGSYRFPKPPEALVLQASSQAESQVKLKPLGEKRIRPRLPLKLRVPSSLRPLKPPTPPLPELGSLGGGLALEELSIAGKKYPFKAEDLIELDRLGDGAYGNTSKMLYAPTQTEMAVKRVQVRELKEGGQNDVMEAALILMAVSCPYIVKTLGCLITNGDIWICMELLDSSMDKIADMVYHQLHSTIPEDVLGKMSVAAIKALDILKTEYKIVHRDIRPSNILMNRAGEIKLSDFGISGRLVDSFSKDEEIGCRPYLAPERIDPMKAGCGYTIQSDVWSFGIVLLEMSLGTFPYGKWSTIFDQLNAVVNGPPPKLPDDGRFSKDLQEFAAACLIKDVEKRPNYKQLQDYSFFRTYDSAEVDTAGWYRHIVDTLHCAF